MARPKRILRRSRAALAAFLETEASGGVVLLVATAAALLWANLLPGYDTFWHSELQLGPITKDLQHWVNDGLMAVFFFVVGLEIKRELVLGELREIRVASLPLVAAIGGMVGPALIYLAFNSGGESARGWAIPMATDIAFVVGALALLGPRVPSGLKLFLLTLAIADDIGAIAVIALVYSGGVHPAIVGVAVGLLVPTVPIRGRQILEALEHRLHPVSSYVVVPLFGLANAGVLLTADALQGALGSGVFWGIVAGLVAGKTIGIYGAGFLGEVARIGRRPHDTSRRHLFGGAVLAGIGFTVSLFITGLAFDSAPLIDQAKLGVLFGSLVSALLGAAILVAGAHSRDR